MVFLELKNISKKYKDRYALKNINLSINKGEILAIAGPPGAGKTTLLKIVAGLVEPDTGRVYLEGKDITNVPPHLRGISMIFEIPPIYPDRTGFDNIAFPLRLKKLPENEIKKRVYKIADLLGIRHVLHRKPDTFSGGEYQRVALARALVTNPTLLLLDEPLKMLDAKIREQMSVWLKQLQEKIGITAIYTTHDPLEALTVGSRAVILLNGEIKQLGDPLEILENPVDLDVDEYISIPALNILKGEAEIDDNVLKIHINNIVLERTIGDKDTASIRESKELIVAVRPADIRVEKEPGPNLFQGKISLLQYLGSRMLATITLDNTTIRAVLPRDIDLGEGDTVYVSVNPDKVRIYDAKTKKRII